MKQEIYEELQHRGINIPLTADWYEFLDTIYLHWNGAQICDFFQWLENYNIGGCRINEQE